jgi:hypothetical protein
MPSFVPLIPAPSGEIAVGDTSDRVSLGFLPSSCTKQNPVLHDSRGGLLAFSNIGSCIFVCNPWTKKNCVRASRTGDSVRTPSCLLVVGSVSESLAR